jgi:hypothetical protein
MVAGAPPLPAYGPPLNATDPLTPPSLSCQPGRSRGSQELPPRRSARPRDPRPSVPASFLATLGLQARDARHRASRGPAQGGSLPSCPRGRLAGPAIQPPDASRTDPCNKVAPLYSGAFSPRRLRWGSYGVAVAPQTGVGKRPTCGASCPFSRSANTLRIAATARTEAPPPEKPNVSSRSRRCTSRKVAKRSTAEHNASSICSTLSTTCPMLQCR